MLLCATKASFYAIRWHLCATKMLLYVIKAYFCATINIYAQIKLFLRDDPLLILSVQSRLFFINSFIL